MTAIAEAMALRFLGDTPMPLRTRPGGKGIKTAKITSPSASSLYKSIIKHGDSANDLATIHIATPTPRCKEKPVSSHAPYTVPARKEARAWKMTFVGPSCAVEQGQPFPPSSMPEQEKHAPV